MKPCPWRQAALPGVAVSVCVALWKVDSSVQETVVLAFHQGVTIATSGTQPALVQNLDSPATVVDDVLLVESARCGSDAAAPHAEHVSDGFLCGVQFIRTHSIVGHQ